MKMTDKLSKWCGMDKIAHFGIGGLIAAIVLIAMALQDYGCGVWRTAHMSWAGLIVTLWLSLIKEIMDTKRDWRDIVAGIAGAFVVVLAAYAGAVLNVLSN